jgi:hypothetical protein
MAVCLKGRRQRIRTPLPKPKHNQTNKNKTLSLSYFSTGRSRNDSRRSPSTKRSIVPKRENPWKDRKLDEGEGGRVRKRARARAIRGVVKLTDALDVGGDQALEMAEEEEEVVRDDRDHTDLPGHGPEQNTFKGRRQKER